MKTKNIPVLIMLVAGAIASICCFIMNYEVKTMLWILIGVLLSFYFVGLIVKKICDKYLQVEQVGEEDTEENADEGEVIEKDLELSETDVSKDAVSES